MDGDDMDKHIIQDINKWLESLKDNTIPSIKDMPEEGMYMEQLLTYLTSKLDPYTVDEEEKLITSYMVNNYVKGGVIPSPEKKKYNKEHLAYLLSICLLKQVVSLDDISFILSLDARDHKENHTTLYEMFKLYHDKEYASLAKDFHNDVEFARTRLNKKLGRATTEGKKEIYKEKTLLSLSYIAFRHAIVAEAHKTLATRLIKEVEEYYKDNDIKNFKK